MAKAVLVLTEALLNPSDAQKLSLQRDEFRVHMQCVIAHAQAMFDEITSAMGGGGAELGDENRGTNEGEAPNDQGEPLEPAVPRSDPSL